MRAEIDELRAELVQVRRTRVDGGGMGQLSARPNVPRPKEFKGTRVAKDVDNFIWSMETYFYTTGVEDDVVRVGMVSMYLVNVALLWWRRRSCNASAYRICTRLCRRRSRWWNSAHQASLTRRRRASLKVGEIKRSPTNPMAAKGPNQLSRTRQGRASQRGRMSGYSSVSYVTGPHMARECPTKAKLAALVKADKDKEEETQLGSLHILSSITIRKANRSKGLMFADVEIAGKEFSTLVDTGASNLFISKEGAKKLGLRVERTREWLKTRSMGNGQKTLSAMQLKRGIQKGEVTYLAALKVDEDAGSRDDVPAEVAQVLYSFKDVMPTELSKKLPPKREVDHRIELVLDAKPPAMALYRMASPKLAELRRQLKELLDVGYVRPSNAPFGAPSGYYQVRIAEGDEPKTACVTRYSSYEFLVMPFGLTNAPATFCTFMNKVLHPFLDRFVVVYLDDIIVYSRLLEDHVEHLRQVFEVFRENSLYVKREKCAFAKREVPFLSHNVGGGRVRMDPSKVASIMEWESPTKVTELRSFLGLANYYRRFIKGYSNITVPLTDLLKKARAWEWTDECQAAFDRLKRVVTDEPVLTLPCYGKPFEVETDASDFAIGGVLMQDGHSIAFKSRKLCDVERRYMVQEKEMMVVVHCLRTWRHYLLGSKFVVRTNNIATSYFKTQKKEGLQHDAKARILLELACEGKSRQFWCEDDLVYTKGRRVYEPLYDNLRREILRDKTEQKSPAGLLEPLPIPERSWESVSMDFIVNLPKSEGCETLMVVVDRFSTYATFIPAKKDCPAEEAARLFVKHVVKYWGVPTMIVSDRDPRFTGRFWTELFKLLGTSLNFSTSLHPQIDGPTERPSTPSTVASGYKGNSPGAHKLAKSWQEKANLARSCLNRATKRMKKWADKKRHHVKYSVGDLVLVKLHNILQHKDVHKGLTWRYEGLFQVLQRVGNVAYKVELPKKLKLHPVFHVSMLKPFQEDKEDPSRADSSCAPIGAKAAYDQDVEQILADRVMRKRWCKPKHEYLIKWKGLPESEVS
ncbi:hypothetical protein CRG98_033274 [Punica granatum]|uniref:Reverse transcriptase n=1 Tax=Punica granatum TaxID=22663 RepID=A0A2I0IQP3_PUNGR|nr:hypothetical protein CRG98_033274 [Punica granatum]